MIRPLTIATLLMACGSGLYLYQSKHEVQLLDRTIERTVHETSALRDQSRLLATEWTMLNDTERLRQFSDTYLGLKSTAPSQFTSLADLGSRLPPPQAEIPTHGADDEPQPVAAAIENAASAVTDAAELPAAEEMLPVPPIPAAPLPVVAAARPAETRTPDRVAVAKPVVAEAPARSGNEARVPEQRQAEQRHAEQRFAARSAELRNDARTSAQPPLRPIVLTGSRPVPVSAPSGPPPFAAAPAAVASRAYALSMPPPSHVAPVPAMAVAPAPYGGSLLGMARSGMPPAPRPTPVNASYNAN
jgi:hypothetical protein